jgi:hypothetical protein
MEVNTMKPSLISAVAGATLLILTSCAPTTKLATEWKAPQKPAPFDKIVAIAMSRDNIIRRIAENEFVKTLPKRAKTTEGLTSYSVIPDAERDDVERVKARLREADADGVVVFRLVDANTQIYANQPGGYYTSFWGYYSWAAPVVFSPGYMMSEEVIRIESLVYDVETAELIWTTITESTDPKSTQKVIDDVVRLAIRRMKELGLVK